MESKLTPILRFTEYEHEWKAKTFKELGSVAMCKRIFKEQTTALGEIPFYKIGTFGKVADSYISRETYEEYKEKYIYPKVGDILLSASGTIGRTVIYDGEDAYFQDSNIIWFNAHKEPLDNSFLYQFYQVVKWSGLEGSTIKRLYNENVLSTNINLPSLDEQKKIGSFFKNLDDTISLHQKELEALKQTKQGFLQKMFPQESELVPNIRFPEYKSEWKPIKLSDLTTFFTDGDWIEAKDQSEEGIRLIQTGNIGISKFLNKPGKEKWITEETFKKLKCHEIYAGDILISRLPEPAGRACILPNLETRMITAVDCTIIRVDDNTSSEFLLQYLSTNQYFNMVKSYLGGGTRQRISRSVLGDLIIKVPKELTEQIKIGKFFRQLDEVIELKEKEIEALKETKKGFLQKMFV